MLYKKGLTTCVVMRIGYRGTNNLSTGIKMIILTVLWVDKIFVKINYQ